MSRVTITYPATLTLLALLSIAPARAAEPQDLVTLQEGTLPVILSAPHGGNAAIPGVPERKGEDLTPGPSGYRTSRDTGTEELAYEAAKAIEARTGRRPYVVVARFHRKSLDPNRPRAIACEHPEAERVYDTYHEALARFCDDVRRKHGGGLLLDLHGQSSARDTVFRGTKNGQTVAALIRRYGDEAQDGHYSLLGLAAAKGWKTHPVPGSREQSGFTGGYIVQTYGSHHPRGLDAVQLEFGADYRSPAAVKKTAATLAEIVDEYLKLYAPARAPVEATRPSHGQ